MDDTTTPPADLDVTTGESHVPVGEGRNQFGVIETRGVDYIPDRERNAKPRSLFWAFLGPQFSLGTYIFGGAMVAAGLSWWACVAAIFVGVGIGSVAVSFLALIGPRTGTNSTVSSGAFFGIRGRYLGTFLAQFGDLGFNVFTLWPAALATMVAVHRLAGTSSGTLSLCIWMAVIGILCCAISVLGHATLVVAYKWSAIVSVVLLAIYVCLVGSHFRTSFPHATYLFGTFWPTWLFALSVGIVNPISYGVVINDYARRIPGTTPPRKLYGSLFSAVFGGNALAYLFGAFTVFCYKTYNTTFPTALADASPLWFLVPLVILAVVGNAIGGGINIYNASLDLHTVLWRISRFSNAILVTLVSFVVTYLCVVVWNVTGFLSTFTDVISAALAPWLAIMIIGHFRNHGRYRVLDLHAYTLRGAPAAQRGAYWYTGGFQIRAVAVWVVATVIALLFSSSTDFVGAFSAHLDKIDLSFLSGFITGGVLYLIFAPAPVGAAVPAVAAEQTPVPD
jgi:purine-cytosine permease-like protein